MKLTESRQVTDKEKRLRAERDEAQKVLDAKQKALDDYRANEASGVVEEMRKIFKGKIIRERQFERCLSPNMKFERKYHYKWIRVRDVKRKWRDEITLDGEVLELDLQPSNFDLADHLSDKDFTKVEMSTASSDCIRVYDNEIDDKFWTEDEVRDVLDRVSEVQKELIDTFFKGASDEG